MKKGIIGKKIGMTQIFDEVGNVIPVTVIQQGPALSHSARLLTRTATKPYSSVLWMQKQSRPQKPRRDILKRTVLR